MIENYLPDEPDGYHYSVEQVSPLVHRVWLHHHREYSYKDGEPVKTVYCFIKGGKVYPPQNYKKMRPKSLCKLTELFKQPPHSTIIPTTTSLLHLK